MNAYIGFVPEIISHVEHVLPLTRRPSLTARIAVIREFCTACDRLFVSDGSDAVHTALTEVGRAINADPGEFWRTLDDAIEEAIGDDDGREWLVLTDLAWRLADWPAQARTEMAKLGVVL